MRPTTVITYCAVVATVLAIGSISVQAAENLGGALRIPAWDSLIGTWVGKAPKGGEIRTTYTSRFKDKIIEITTKDGEKESVSLMGRNPKTGKVFYLSADNQGGSGLGECKLEDGQPILDLIGVTGDGQEGAVRIRTKFEDNDTMTITIDAKEPVTLKMTRVNSQNSKSLNKTDASDGK